MKRRFVIYAILLGASINILYSQRGIITNDSLRNHFKYETAYEVLITYYQRNFYSSVVKFDYKDLYYDETMKDSLLRWIDDDVIVNQKINQNKDYLIKNFNDLEKKSFTNNYISNDLKLNFDSIYSDTTLYQSYYELALIASLDRYKEDIIQKKGELIPTHEVLYLHSKIVYPAAYKKIKQWWYMDDDLKKSSLFGNMLMMNDPQAQCIFDKTIKDMIKSKGESIHDVGFISSIKQIENAYAVKKLLELLPIRKKILVMSGDPLVPLDFFTFDALLEMLERHNIKGNFIPYSKLIGMSTLEELKYFRDNKKAIEEACVRLIRHMEKEEEYWMKNVPFDYNF